MADTPTIPIQIIEWPKIRIGAQEFTLRLSYSAYYQISKWNAKSDLETAAACAGHFDVYGKWHSAGFANSMGLVDLISEQPAEQQDALIAQISAALGEAVKKAQLRPAPLTPSETEKTAA